MTSVTPSSDGENDQEAQTSEEHELIGKFVRFHEANPHVYRTLVRSARTYRSQTGQAKCGMSLLFGRARWVLIVETDEKAPGLSNAYAAFYSRMIMRQESDLSEMFDVRKSVADIMFPEFAQESDDEA